jgi:hypothetical protein
MTGAVTVLITPAGAVRFLHDDRLAPLYAEGAAQLRRASHVEPTPDGRWTADLAPVGGPHLGPFALRQQALDAERAWLDTHLAGLPA